MKNNNNTFPFQDTLTKEEKFLYSIRSIIDGYESIDDEKDEKFLKEHGIKRLTNLRDSIDTEHEPMTDIDKMMKKNGLLGNINNSAMQDFVCEKDGIQFLVFTWLGIWMTGNHIHSDGILVYIEG